MQYPRAAAWALATFATALLAGEWLGHQDLQVHRAERRAAALVAARAASDQIESELSRALSATYALAAVVRIHPEYEDFDQLAADLLPLHPGVSSLQLAPDGVVRRIHPLAGNEAALGHDLLRDPARRAEAEAAIASRQLVLAGPFPLRQDGMGMAGRYPVFLSHGGVERFWGFVIALVHLAPLLESSRIDRLAADGLAWELSRSAPAGGASIPFAGSPGPLPADSVGVAVVVPNGRWTLRVAPERGWAEPAREVADHALALLLATLVAAVAYRLARQPEILRREVAARTAELRQAYQRLEADTAQRLRAEEQLREAQKLEAVGELAGGVAHDFNNLLTGIVASADELQAGLPAGGPAGEQVQNIREAAGRAAELTRQLLGFARRGKNRIVAVDVHQLVQDVLRLLSRTVDKRIALSPQLHSDRSMVLGDPGQLEQAILNLAVNARDAMPAGGRMTFESREEEVAVADLPAGLDLRPGRYLALTVADTGPGVPADVQARVFEPFFTTKPPGQGTGMGLAMVYGIARNHGGWASLRSEPGQGARFTLHLPLHEAAVAPAATARPPAPVADRGGRVLVVDDDPVALGAATRMLRRLGYEPLPATGGAEAVARVLAHPGEALLALIDLSMPGMDGAETWRALRSADPALRGVLTSGYGRDGRVEAALGEGMCHFLPKPYGAGELAQILAEAAGGPPAPLPAPRGAAPPDQGSAPRT